MNAGCHPQGYLGMQERLGHWRLQRIRWQSCPVRRVACGAVHGKAPRWSPGWLIFSVLSTPDYCSKAADEQLAFRPVLQESMLSLNTGTSPTTNSSVVCGCSQQRPPRLTGPPGKQWALHPFPGHQLIVGEIACTITRLLLTRSQFLKLW